MKHSDTEEVLHYRIYNQIVSKWKAFEIVFENERLDWEAFLELEGLKENYTMKQINTFIQICKGK